MGEGSVHDEAENMGDEIDYEEQVMGHKDEEKHEGDGGKKEEEDIEMEGDF